MSKDLTKNDKKIGFIISLRNKKTGKHSILPIIFEEEVVKEKGFNILDYVEELDSEVLMVESYHSLKVKLVALKQLANKHQVDI